MIERTSLAINKCDEISNKVILLQDFNKKVADKETPTSYNKYEAGRTCILINKKIKTKQIKTKKELTLITVKLSNQTLAIGSVYIAPSTTFREFEDAVLTISEELKSVKHLNIILTGDINCTHESWSYKISSVNSARGMFLRTYLQQIKLQQIEVPDEDNWTFYHTATDTIHWIDVFMVNFQSDAVIKRGWIDNRKYDHRYTEVKLKYDPFTKPNYEEKRFKVVSDEVIQKLAKAADQLNELDNLTSVNSLDLVCTKLTHNITIAYEESTQIINKRHIHKVDNTKDLRKLLKKLAKKQSILYSKERQETITSIRRQINTRTKKYLEDKLGSHLDVSKKWRLVNELLGIKEKTTEEDSTEQYLENKTKELDSYETQLNIMNMSHSQKAIFYKEIVFFDDQMLKEALSEMKHNAAPGIDQLRYCDLKELIKTHSKQIIKLLNLLMTNTIFPTSWKISNCAILPKSDGKRCRVVHMQSGLAKLFEILILKELRRQLPENTFYRQYAYSDNKGPIDLVADTLFKFEGLMYHETGILSMDIESAFDKIKHSTVLESLINFKVEMRLIILIASYLNNRKAAIQKDNDQYYKTITNSVPQGSILGPILFNIGIQKTINKINSIIIPEPKKRKNFNTRDPDDKITLNVYADDLIVPITGFQLSEVIAKANKIFEIVKNEFSEIQLQIKQEKTKLFIPVEGKLDSNLLKNNNLEITNKMKLLGIELIDTYKKNFTQPIIEKLNQKAALLLSRIHNFRLLNPKIQKQIISSYLLSDLNYAAPIIFHEVYTRDVQKKNFNKPLAMLNKRIYGLRHRNPTLDTMILTGMEPVWSTILKNAFNYYLQRFTKEGPSNIVMRFFEKYPECSPRVRNDQIFYNSKLHVERLIQEMLQNEWEKKGRETTRFFLPTWKPLERMDSMTLTKKMVMGYYNPYLCDKTKLCECGYGPNTVEHWATSCFLFRQTRESIYFCANRRRITTWQQIVLKLEKTKILHKHFDKIYKYARNKSNQHGRTELPQNNHLNLLNPILLSED